LWRPLIKNRTASFFAHTTLLFAVALLAMVLPIALFKPSLLEFSLAVRPFPVVQTAFMMSLVSMLIVYLGTTEESVDFKSPMGTMRFVDASEIWMITGFLAFPVVLIPAPESQEFSRLYWTDGLDIAPTQYILVWWLHWLVNWRYLGYRVVQDEVSEPLHPYEVDTSQTPSPKQQDLSMAGADIERLQVADSPLAPTLQEVPHTSLAVPPEDGPTELPPVNSRVEVTLIDEVESGVITNIRGEGENLFVTIRLDDGIEISQRLDTLTAAGVSINREEAGGLIEEGIEAGPTGAQSPVLSPVVPEAPEPLPEVPAVPPPPTSLLSSGTQEFDPDTITADPDRFQFKGNTNEDGVSPYLMSITEWDSFASGIVLVWEQKDGQRFIVDGHQRLALAKRLKGQGQEAVLEGLLLREVDGWTVPAVRSKSITKNVGEDAAG
jgi:hypothetical protein